jgi:cell division protease FtsH
MIDEEVKQLLKKCYDEAKQLLSENRDVLDEIAKYLYDRETITGKEFMKIFRRVKGLPEPVDTSDMSKSEKVAESVTFHEDGTYSSTVREPDDDFWKKIEEKKQADAIDSDGSTESNDTTQN